MENYKTTTVSTPKEFIEAGERLMSKLAKEAPPEEPKESILRKIASILLFICAIIGVIGVFAGSLVLLAIAAGVGALGTALNIAAEGT